MTNESRTGKRQLRTDNHYVPRLYLKHWAQEGHICTYRILVPHQRCPIWRRYSLDAIAKHKHLYTKIVLSGESDEFERWLCDDIETPAEGAIDRALNDDQLSKEDWHTIIRFVAAQDVRTPARLVEMLRRTESYGEDIQRAVTASVEKMEIASRQGRKLQTPTIQPSRFPFPAQVSVNPSGAPEGGGTLKVCALIGRAMWLHQLERLLTHTFHVLALHHWTIVRSPKGHQWMTSDDPVIRLRGGQSGHYDFKGGWANRGGVILMPLGPGHLLFTEIGSKEPWLKGTRLPIELFARMQRMIVEHAHRYIFSVSENPGIADIRPRAEDSRMHRAEAEQWALWHAEQSVAERELL